MGTVLVDGSEVIDEGAPAVPPALGAKRYRLNGLTVDLVLNFESGLQAKAIAPVMSAEDPIYASAKPTS